MNLNKIRKNIFLLPFLFFTSVLYRLIIDIRNLLFDSGIIKIYKYNIPIISVGNITAGGTGKTPFILYLIEKLNQHFKNIVVVSRGYGRDSKGLQIVSDGKRNIVGADIGGDEPVLIASKFPNIPVIVSEERYKGIERAIEDFDAKLILLDDAFQHRHVARDCDIVLVDANQPVHKDNILPLGKLREKKINLNRADIIVITKMRDKIETEIQVDYYKNFSAELYLSFYLNSNIKYVNSNSEELPNEFRKGSFIAFAGIANPEIFFKNVQDIGLKISESIINRDHVKYTSLEINKILETANKQNCNNLITTEKDLVKLNVKDFDNYNLFVMEMKIEIKNEENFIKKVKNCIDST